MKSIPGDQVSVSVLVPAPPVDAFRVFTEEINLWWRHGLKYHRSGAGRSVLHIEPRVGGRFLESIDTGGHWSSGPPRPRRAGLHSHDRPLVGRPHGVLARPHRCSPAVLTSVTGEFLEHREREVVRERVRQRRQDR